MNAANPPAEPDYSFPQAVEMLSRMLAQYGRVPAANVYASPVITTPIGPGLSSPAVNIKFPEPGLVIAVYGQEAAGTAAQLAQTEVRIQMAGVQDLFVDGQGGGTTFPMLGLFGGAQNWFPVMRRANPGADWIVTFTYKGAANATPRIGLSFIGDSTLKSLMA